MKGGPDGDGQVSGGSRGGVVRRIAVAEEETDGAAARIGERDLVDIDAGRLADLTDGYIASDIAYIVNDAAMGAAFSDQPITQQLLEDTIRSIRPSISREVVSTYENLRQRMEDTDARNRRPKIGFV